jgi:hypothetical protein
MKFKIENENVICYITPDNKLYEQSKLYRIDLSERKMFLDTIEMAWDLPEEIECQIVNQGIKDSNMFIESNYSIIFSYRNKGDDKNVAKYERLLEDNKKIREFLNEYKLKYCNFDL